MEIVDQNIKDKEDKYLILLEKISDSLSSIASSLKKQSSSYSQYVEDQYLRNRGDL